MVMHSARVLVASVIVRLTNPPRNQQRGFTALAFAALVGHTECLRVLLEAGAETDMFEGVRTLLDTHFIFQRDSVEK